MSTSAPLEELDHVDGPTEATLELIMYGDFQCPYCIAAHPIVGRVRERLGPRLRFVFRHFPLRDVHPDAQLAAEASEAAAEQDRFWEMYELLYESRGRLDRADLVSYAAQLDLDLERFASTLDDGTFAERVDRDVASGEAASISGTPAFFAGGRRHDGSFDSASLIEALEASA